MSVQDVKMRALLPQLEKGAPIRFIFEIGFRVSRVSVECRDEDVNSGFVGSGFGFVGLK